MYFNSHPHEEDDEPLRFLYTLHIQFQLTSSRRGWRPTKWIPGYCGDFNSHPHEEDDNCRTSSCHVIDCISTHILTKRMTYSALPAENWWGHFNSHPHEEDDEFDCKDAGKTDISTHILTKRMTADEMVYRPRVLFQLTSSRRGWRWYNLQNARRDNFNSHPHEEDDIASLQYMTRQEHFNSHPHEEDDWLERRKK